MQQSNTGGSGKKSGASVIFANSSGQVLLVLRDDKKGIPFPNCWDILGGVVEPNETPRECIVREIQEEIGYALDEVRLFKVTDFEDRVEHTFFHMANFDINAIRLNEGQRLKWFSKAEIQSLPAGAIAFGFREVLLDFFDRHSSSAKQPK